MAVRSGFPILVTGDLERLAGFYESAFAARRTYTFTGDDGVAAYVALAVGGAELGVARDDVATTHGRVTVWFYVDDAADVDATYRRAVTAGAEPEAEPTLMPWGERVAQVRDPDGLVVSIAAPPAGDPPAPEDG